MNTALLKFLPDKVYLQLQYWKHYHHFADLDNPKSLNEKIMWLKLYNRRPEYTIMVDKYAAKHFIGERINQKYIVPTLGVWNDFHEIDFDKLPNRFVLKWNHDSGSIVVCKDKSTFDISHAAKLLEHGKKTNGFWYGREWPYKNVPHRLLAEEFLGDNLQDYRVYCYNGVPKYIYTYTNESMIDGSKPEPTHCDIYNCEWEPMPFRQKCPPKGDIQRPSGLSEMLSIAAHLSEGVPFLRVDFYQIGSSVYVGELTFFPGSGITKFIPEEWDDILGSWLALPEKQG